MQLMDFGVETERHKWQIVIKSYITNKMDILNIGVDIDYLGLNLRIELDFSVELKEELH
jgi:hypothetical protein